jgi:histone acetyltransferase
LTTFPTPRIADTESLYKQLQPFHRPTGGKTGGKNPVLPLPQAIDVLTPGSHGFDQPMPGDVSDGEDERPNKRRRMSGEDEEMLEMDEAGMSPKHGKKPSGKTTSRKERMPRTVVRSARGLVPMETDADGTQHVGGQLPDTVLQDGVAAKGVPEAEGEEEEEGVPLAQQRPQLEEGERKRREIAKEKEKEREVEVLRNRRKEDVEVWEGVELVRLHCPP